MARLSAMTVDDLVDVAAGLRSAAAAAATLRALMTEAVREGRILTVPEEPGVDRSLLPEAEGRFVYKQERCRRCGTPVDVDTIDGRTSYACPRCQPLIQG